MMYRTHLVFGVFIGLIYLSLFAVPGDKYLFLSYVGLASMFPDIDHKDSKIGGKIKPLNILIEKIFGHRGFFHSVFPAIILYLVFAYIFGLKYVGIALGIGYLSHLLSDALTVTGINFLYPSKLKLSGFIKTGGAVEYVFFLVFLGLDLWKISAIIF